MSSSVGDVVRSCGLSNLGSNPPHDAIESALRQLALLAERSDPLRRATLREAAIQALKVAGCSSPAGLVDTALRTSVQEGPSQRGRGGRIVLSDPSPWPIPVDGGELLDEVTSTLRRFVSLPPHSDLMIALWILHAHAHETAVVSPILGITSATKRCGKSTLLTIVSRLVPRPLLTANATPAVIFRLIEADCPALLIDEADTFLPDRNELRGVLNSGHSRATATVVRCAGDNHQPETFSTWSPKAIAMIGDLPDTLRDRSVEVRLQRRRERDVVERLRLDQLPALEPIRERCARWALDHSSALADADPEVPDCLDDRAADNWRHALAIAEQSGGDWSHRARNAAKALSGAPVHDGDLGEQVLEDILECFRQEGATVVPSGVLVGKLGAMESRPWPESNRGTPVTAAQLAKLLKPFGIRPRQHKLDGEKVRGYARSDFVDVWERYGLRPDTQAGTSVPSSDAAGSERYRAEAGSGQSTGFEPEDRPALERKVPGYHPGELPGFIDVPDEDYEAFEREAIQEESRRSQFLELPTAPWTGVR